MTQTYLLHTNNLTCVSCANKIEDEIKALDDVSDAKINIINSTATIMANRNIIEQVNQIVTKHEPGVFFTETEQAKVLTFPKHLIATLILFIISMITSRVYPIEQLTIFYTFFYLAIYFFTGKNVIRSFWRNIKSKDFFDENFLMFIATAGAITIGAFEEAAGVMLFYSIGEAFESLAVRKSNNEIFNLASLKPDRAFKLVNGLIMEVLPESIVKDDTLVVKVGEVTPVDGTITDGNADFDMSSITGESAPVFLQIGDTVVSGSIPLTSAVTITATVDYADSTISKITKLISEATSNKSDTEKFITKFSKIYTPVVVMLAGLVILIPVILKFMGVSFFVNPYSDYFYNGLIFLVISCPCALVLSVPLTYFAGIGKAANQGILIKGSAYLEQIRGSKTFIFDKTGTITEGHFAISNVNMIENKSTTIEEKELLKMVAALEQFSTHPVTYAFTHVDSTDFLAENVTETAGTGIEGDIATDKVAVGNKRMLDKYNIDSEIVKLSAGVNLFVIINHQFIATITLTDNIKPDAAETLNYIQKNGGNTIILSGDSEQNVSATAKSLNIDEYHNSLTPSEKLEKMNLYRSIKTPVTSLGDGINDAPLLAASDIGIAMGSTGAALSVEMADIIFLGNKLGKLKTLIKIAHRTHRIVIENIVFIMAVKSIIMILGALGYATLWEAVIADVGVALATVLNSIKIFRK